MASVRDPTAKQQLCFIFWLFCLRFLQMCQVVVQEFPKRKPADQQSGVAQRNLAECVHPWKQVSNYVIKEQSCLYVITLFSLPYFLPYIFLLPWKCLCVNFTLARIKGNSTQAQILTNSLSLRVHATDIKHAILWFAITFKCVYVSKASTSSLYPDIECVYLCVYLRNFLWLCRRYKRLYQYWSSVEKNPDHADHTYLLCHGDTTVAPCGCSAVSVLSLRIWVKFFWSFVFANRCSVVAADLYDHHWIIAKLSILIHEFTLHVKKNPLKNRLT